MEHRIFISKLQHVPAASLPKPQTFAGDLRRIWPWQVSMVTQFEFRRLLPRKGRSQDWSSNFPMLISSKFLTYMHWCFIIIHHWNLVEWALRHKLKTTLGSSTLKSLKGNPETLCQLPSPNKQSIAIPNNHNHNNLHHHLSVPPPPSTPPKGPLTSPMTCFTAFGQAMEIRSIQLCTTSLSAALTGVATGASLETNEGMLMPGV